MYELSDIGIHEIFIRFLKNLCIEIKLYKMLKTIFHVRDMAHYPLASYYQL